MEELKDLLDYLEILKPGRTKTVCDEQGNFLLHHSAFENDVSVVKQLIRLGCEIDAKNELGITPFDIAVYHDNVEVAEVLLKAGASLEHSVFNTGIGSPLHHAAAHGSVKMVNFLLKDLVITGDYNIDSRSSKGFTPLVCAVSKNRLDVVKVLIEAGCDLTATDSQGHTPLFFSIVCYQAGSNESYEIVKTLIEAGSDINLADNDGISLIHQAGVTDKDFRLIPLLLQNGAEVNTTDRNGGTPIHVAITSNSYHAVKALIEAGAKLDWKDQNDNTILHYAMRTVEPKIIKLLLEKGASLHAVNDGDIEPFIFGIFSFQFLPTDDKDFETSLQRKFKCLKLLLRQGTDINRVSSVIGTALAVTLYCTLDSNIRDRVVSFLLNNKAIVNFNDKHVQDTINLSEKKEISKLLMKHVAFCEAQGHSDELIKNFDLDKMPRDFQEHYRICKAELEKMKQWTIVENEFTLYDVLVAKKISHYVCKENALTIFEKVSSMKLFPIYIEDLRRRFEKEKKKQKRLGEARNGLSRLIKWDVSLFTVVYENILRYLPKSDLHTLSLI